MRIPIKIAKQVAKETSNKQVIIVAWDGKSMCVTTYGKSLTDCIQAARCGNQIKKFYKWPEHLCRAVPARAKGREKECLP